MVVTLLRKNEVCVIKYVCDPSFHVLRLIYSHDYSNRLVNNVNRLRGGGERERELFL